ncbi:MAG: hypothetical protein ACRD8W_00975 [Nitrososphaeraceae archaeon]
MFSLVLNGRTMKVVNNFITLILLTAILSVITNVHVTASTDDGPEEEAEEAAEEGRTEVYDDNPDLDKDGTVTEEENQKFTDAAVALGDRLNSPEGVEEEENNEIPNCDFDEFVNDDNECEKIPEAPVTAALPPCDGSFQDCVTQNGDVCLAGASTHECELPNPGDETVSPAAPVPPVASNVPFPDADEEEDEDRYDDPNPYCDKLSGDFPRPDCHDRKDYDEETLLYPCNDGSHEERWQDCPDATEKDKDEDEESSHSTTATLTVAEPDPNRFSPIGGGVYFPTESIPNPDRLIFGPFGILLPNQANEEFGSNVIASTASVEESSCKIIGSADGILQEFDTAKYQACGLYANGQKAYSDGFVTGCTQVGNTQLICQAFADSNILNTKIPATQIPAQVAAAPTQGIQPAAVN